MSIEKRCLVNPKPHRGDMLSNSKEHVAPTELIRNPHAISINMLPLRG